MTSLQVPETLVSRFEYQNLESDNHIRLIELGRGSGDEPIKCRVVHTALGQRSFEALSYEWGSPPDDRNIVVNEKNVSIRSNLELALRHVRSSDHVRVLWIDALSINQHDIRERGHQVQIMGKIYEMADQVVVWLGLAKNDSDLAIATFKSIYAYDRMFRFGFPATPVELGAAKSSFLNVNNQHSAAELQAVLDLCSRSYWQRVWVLQEIQLARKLEIHCGDRIISGDVFEHVYRYFRGYVQLGVKMSTDYSNPLYRIYKSIAFAAHFKMRVYWIPGRATSTKPRFQEYLLDCCLAKDFKSTEPRDLVYALLSLGPEASRGGFVTDYDAPIEEVFLAAMRKCDRSLHKMWANLLAKKLGMNTKDVPTILKEAGVVQGFLS